MNVHQKGKNIHSQQQQQTQQPTGPPSYPNQQQARQNAPYHFDDASQKFGYPGPYVGGTGAGQVPPRLPLVPGLPGPTPTIAASNSSVGGMPSGPPPGTFGHGAHDLSKQTPPHHQSAHHSLPPASLGVNQQIAMVNASGHNGPMQGRPTQGNNQFFGRPIRPGNQHMPRPPMTGVNHPPNAAQPLPYPGQLGMNHQPVLFVIGDQFNNQSPYLSYATNPPAYYPNSGTLPPAGNVTFPQPRATQQTYGYRQNPPYPAFPIQSTPAVYYQQQPQPQQPQQQQQQPQQQQQQSQQQPQQQPQQQQPQQVPVAPPPTAQPRESTGASRRARSSALRIVDPNTNRDILTGEEVPPSAVVTPTTAAPPDVATTGAVSLSTLATDGVEAPATTPVPSTKVTEESAASLKLEIAPTKALIVEEKVEEKTPPAPVTVTPTTQSVPTVPATVTVPVVATAELPNQVDKEVAIAALVTQENGEVPLPSELPSISTSPTPVSTSASPDQGDGRGNQKGGKNKRKNSRSGSTPTPPTPPPPQSVEEVKTTQPVVVSTELPTPSREKDVPAVAQVAPNVFPSKHIPEVESSSSLESEIKETSQPLAVVPESVIVEESPDKTTTIVVSESVITNGDKQGSSPPSSVIETVSTPLSAVDDGENRAPGKSTSLKYTYKDDQWSPVNPEGKKTYDRLFLLELQNNPASQKKPEGLPSLEVVRDKGSTIKRGVSVGDFTPPFVKRMPDKGLPKRNSQQGSRDQGMGQQQPPPRREIKLMNSLIRQERPEDPNVWKPKHASKSKEEKENPDKASTEEMLKTVRGILNKLTPSKFDKLLERIQALNISTEDRLSGVIKLFFEKAVDEPIFSSTYAKMCQALSTKEVASSANPAETTNFRKLLLTRCQKEFEKDSAGLVDVENKKKEIESAETEMKKKELEDELEELVNINRRRSLGNIRFIGELFKLRILSVKIMHQCILRLLSQPEDEESLECLCRLLSTIGKELETPMQPTGRSTSTSSARETMNSYFSSLDAIVQKRKISNRIRFMIQDVVDLRKSQWKPRRDDNAPKTIEQIHRDVHKEREDQERELNNPQFQANMGSMGGMSRDGRMGDRRGDRGDDRNRKPSRPSDDGWNMVNSGNRGGNAKLDMKQLRIPKAPGDADQGTISLGPGGRGMGSWGRGASGGMSQSLIGGVGGGGGTTQEPRSNRYQILEDDSGTHESGKAPFSGRSSLGGPPQSGRGGSQDYRTMPGATKSAFFPTKDVDRGLDSLRSQNSGVPGRSRSQQSSRENSVTRPIRETPQPPPLSREVSKDVLLGKSTSTDDEIERKAHSLLGEFFTNESIEDAVLDMKEWLHSSTVTRFINQCLLHVLEHNRTERRATGTLFKEMVKRKLFTSADIMEGFTELLQSAEDFLVDIPKLWEYTAELVEPLFEEGVINLNFLGQLSSTLNSSLVANFVTAVLKELVKAQGTAGAERIWIMSNAPLASVLPSGVDLNAFLAQHKELEFLLKIDSTPRSSGSVASKSSGNAAPASQVYLEFQQSLEQYLRHLNSNASLLTTDDVCSWIQKQHVGEVNSAFIRALVTAVTESSIEGRGTDSKLNNTILKHWTEVLRRYVDNIADRELQLLFAVQTLVTQRQHPKGLIQGIFETLYDSNVVSEEGFESWVSVDDPSEREGKAVALKSITSFLTWLKEADPESDQEADA